MAVAPSEINFKLKAEEEVKQNNEFIKLYYAQKDRLEKENPVRFQGKITNPKYSETPAQREATVAHAIAMGKLIHDEMQRNSNPSARSTPNARR